MPLHESYNSQLKPQSRELRKEMTPQERHLWYDFLRKYPVQWKRQRPIDRCIVDFYCERAGLVIELDGSQHYEPDAQAYDRRRTERLNKYGLEVMRISNLDIDHNFPGVCEAIDLKVKERLSR